MYNKYRFLYFGLSSKAREILKEINMDDSIFLGIRTNCIQGYYNGQKMFTLYLNGINERFEFNKLGRAKELNSKGEINEKGIILNKLRKEFTRKTNKIVKKFFLDNKFNYDDFQLAVKEYKNFIDKNNEISPIPEKTIQIRDYASKYKYKNNCALFFIDVEYAKSYLNDDDKKKYKDEFGCGRCDFIALYRDASSIYNVAYIELKSRRSAINGDSGVISHINDMDKVLRNYTKQPNNDTPSEKMVLSKLVESTKKIYDIDDIEICFDNPKFYILFDAGSIDETNKCFELASKRTNRLSKSILGDLKNIYEVK